MNKTAIKNFSIWARKKLIADAAYRAGLMGITKDGIAAALPQSTGTTEFYDIGTREPYALTGDAVMQRRRLVDTIRRKERDTDYATAYKYILEEVAYTWFNRLIAIRFMEVNDYLPSHVRVLSSESGKLEPDLVTKPFDADLEFSTEEAERIFRLQQDNDVDALFQLLFIKQCNALHKILPGLFEMTQDVTELLFRVSVVDPEGVVYHLVHDIPEEDFDVSRGGQVEIIGWLYQYYNTEPKNEAFAKNGKISKEEIPAVTQLFTPDWIVRYMVENSLGRLWLDKCKGEAGLSDVYMNGSYFGWKYYVEDAKQEPEVEAKLAEYRRSKKDLTPDQITFLDPCMGSGHILVYAFDVFITIYRSMGWSDRDAAQRIIQKNLYGLDIDERATQLAYFSLMMKARQYDRRFFTRNLQPNVFCPKGYPEGEEFGSLIKVEELEPAPDFDHWTLHDGDYQNAMNRWSFRYVLSQKYDVVITNPPYMGISSMGGALYDYVCNNYAPFKQDLYCMFVNRLQGLTKPFGYQAMITQQSFMFNSRFEEMRDWILSTFMLANLVYLDTGAFEEISGEKVRTCMFVFRNKHLDSYFSTFIDLRDAEDAQKKEQVFLDTKQHNGAYMHILDADSFRFIDGLCFSYWLSPKLLKILSEKVKIGQFAETRHGLVTGNGELFMRLWYEVPYNNLCLNSVGDRIWYPYNKGGSFRRWYGNREYVVNWSNNGNQIKNYRDKSGSIKSSNYNEGYNLRPNASWSDIRSGKIAFRYTPQGALFDTSGPSFFAIKPEDIYKLLGFVNTNTMQKLIDVYCTGLHYATGAVERVPLKGFDTNGVEELAKENILNSKSDWDAFETSWDFKTHPLVAVIPKGGPFFEIGRIELYECFELWKAECEERFQKLKANEEELNRIFIDIYGLQDELTPEVEDKDITVRRADLGRDIRSLVSYAVGCMFGRYSLNKEGLAFAGGDWDDSKYRTFLPDADNVIPITDEGYLEDDIVTRFVNFIRTVYGEQSLEANLDFIAKALGNKGSTSREVIRNYFLNDFFNDHCQTYSVTGSGKRPIYWLFDSGKQNGFKALIYLHRYTPDTVGTLRVDYLHRLQRVYESEIDRMQDMIDNSSNSREIAAATKRKEKLIKQLKECRDYDEKLAHLALARISLDLDDGVKVNYRKLQTAPDGKFYEVLAQSKNIMAKEK